MKILKKSIACELQIIHLNLTQENPQKIRCILKKSVACEFQIIHLNLTQKNPQLLLPGNMLEFTQSLKWVETNITFPMHFHVYLDHPFFEHRV